MAYFSNKKKKKNLADKVINNINNLASIADTTHKVISTVYTYSGIGLGAAALTGLYFINPKNQKKPTQKTDNSNTSSSSMNTTGTKKKFMNRRKSWKKRKLSVYKVNKDLKVLRAQVKPELKCYSELVNASTTQTYTEVQQAGLALKPWYNWPKTGPSQGTKVNERLGNEITLRSIRLRLHFCRNSSSTETCQLIRVILFRDPSMNYMPTAYGGAEKTLGELIYRLTAENPSSNGLITQDQLNSKEVIPILDETILITSSNPTGFINFKKTYKKGIKVGWKTEADGTNLCTKNSYSMFIVGDSTANKVTFNGQIRWYYTDA